MTASDCRSDEGVLIGLVDGIIAQARVVARYLRNGPTPHELSEALADMAADEDVALLISAGRTPREQRCTPLT